MSDLLLVASGISAWLAVYNFVVFGIRRDRLTLWVALWSSVSFVYQFTRHMQLQPEGTDRLELVDWVCFAAATTLIPLVFLVLRELTKSALFPRASRLFAMGLAGTLGLHSTTHLFLGTAVDHYVNFWGDTVLYTRVGPLYLVLLVPLSIVALIMGISMVMKATTLSRREQLVWLGAMGLYQVMGANDVLLFSGVTRAAFPSLPGQSLFEFGVTGMAVALSLRTARRAEISQQQLEQQVELRTAQLERALDDARTAIEAKAAFLASMSHEVRTPLNGIIGLTELMLEEGLPDAARERLALVLRSGRTLKSLVDDVLDFAKLDANSLKLSPTEFSCEGALHDTVALYEGTARAKGLRLTLEHEDLPAVAFADEQRLKQVVSNLVNNAIKFTVTGEVRVRARAMRVSDTRAELSIDVTDTGCGISAQDQERLFRPFSQVGVAMNAPGQGGTGLGLAICRELAHMMRGDVSMVSEPGKGSTFSLTMPVDVRSWIRPATATIAESTGRYQARVLVAEDNPVNALVTQGLLKSLGLEPTLAVNGREAVSAARANGFALILMDCQMPELDGFEATRELRALKYEGPIIALTAFASEEDRERCLAAGMTDYLTKPLRKSDLDALLSRYLERVTEPAAA